MDDLLRRTFDTIGDAARAVNAVCKQQETPLRRYGNSSLVCANHQRLRAKREREVQKKKATEQAGCPRMVVFGPSHDGTRRLKITKVVGEHAHGCTAAGLALFPCPFPECPSAFTRRENMYTHFCVHHLGCSPPRKTKEARLQPTPPVTTWIPTHSLSESELALSTRIACTDDGDEDEVVCPPFLTRRCFATLNESKWLNDEIVNAFVKLVARGFEDQVHVFDSFFLERLGRGTAYNYQNVRRFTTAEKRATVDIFAKRALIIPVNQSGVHWCLVAVDIRNKIVLFLDSMGGFGDSILAAVLRYVRDEHRDKHQTELASSEQWKCITPETCRQDNSNDCGVFTCYFAKVLVHYFCCGVQNGGPPPVDATFFPFSCGDMPRLRQQIKLDLYSDRAYCAG